MILIKLLFFFLCFTDSSSNICHLSPHRSATCHKVAPKASTLRFNEVRRRFTSFEHVVKRKFQANFLAVLFSATINGRSMFEHWTKPSCVYLLSRTQKNTHPSFRFNSSSSGCKSATHPYLILTMVTGYCLFLSFLVFLIFRLESWRLDLHAPVGHRRT